MIRLNAPTGVVARDPLREVLGLPPSAHSGLGNTTWKRRRMCPREARFAELGVRKTGVSRDALDFGDAHHLALETYYRARQGGASWNDATKAAWDLLQPLYRADGYGEFVELLERVLAAYFETAATDRWDVLAIEEQLEYFGLDFDYTARLDLLVYCHDRRGMYVVEHKTASAIPAWMTQGYSLDQQTLGQDFLMHECVDLDQLPPYKGLIVNITSKPKSARTAVQVQRVDVAFRPEHRAEFRASLAAWSQVAALMPQLGYPKAFGTCAGPSRYFSVCDYFDICHGHPTFSLAGVDKLLPDDLPFGFTVTNETEPTS